MEGIWAIVRSVVPWMTESSGVASSWRRTHRPGRATSQSRASSVSPRALGLEVVSVGIRDVIPPGDMKALMNKSMEAKLISRREENDRHPQPGRAPTDRFELADNRR